MSGRYFIGCTKPFDQNGAPPLCKYDFVALSEATVA